MFPKRTPNASPRPDRSAPNALPPASTSIGPGVELKGDIQGKTDVELLGTMEGNLEIQGRVVVREKGKLIGDIHATHVVVEGEVEGQIAAQQKIALTSTGRIRGDLEAAAVSVAEGAFFHGKVQMNGNEALPARPSTKTDERRPVLATESVGATVQ